MRLPMLLTDLGNDHLRQERAKRTRHDILLSAARCFERDGYSATRLDQIGRDADVTKGALYFHFRSKAEIAKALLEAHHARWAQIYLHTAATGLPPLDLTVALSFAVARNYRSSVIARGGVRLGNEHNLIDAEIPPPFVGWIRSLTDLLVQAHDDGALSPHVDPSSAAHGIVASYFGIQEMSARLTGSKDLLTRLREWWTMYLPGLGLTPDQATELLSRFTDRGAVRSLTT